MKRVGIPLCCALLLAAGFLWSWRRSAPSIINNITLSSLPVIAQKQAAEKKRSLSAAAPEQNFREVEEIAERINRDQVCQPDGLEYFPEVAPTLSYRALTYAAGEPADPCVLAMIEANPIEAYQYAASAKDPACRLIVAMMLTEQWTTYSSMPPVPADMAKGEAILEELKAADPDNGIYSLLLLGSGVDDGYRAFLTAPRFSNPLVKKLAHLREMGSKNTAAYMAAVRITAGLPPLDLRKGANRARALAEAEAFVPEAMEWREKLVKRFERKAELNLFDVVGQASEDSFLVGIANKIPGAIPQALSAENFRKYYGHRVFGRFDLSTFDSREIYTEEELKICANDQDALRRWYPQYSAEISRMLAGWRSSELF